MSRTSWYRSRRTALVDARSDAAEDENMLSINIRRFLAFCEDLHPFALCSWATIALCSVGGGITLVIP